MKFFKLETRLVGLTGTSLPVRAIWLLKSISVCTDHCKTGNNYNAALSRKIEAEQLPPGVTQVMFAGSPGCFQRRIKKRKGDDECGLATTMLSNKLARVSSKINLAWIFTGAGRLKCIYYYQVPCRIMHIVHRQNS